MKNTEQDYRDQQKAGSRSVEKTNQDYNKRKGNAAMPGEIEEKPSVTLPITGEVKRPVEGNTADDSKEVEGNNYTAAENDHQTNSTL